MKKLLSTILCLVLAFAITCSFAGCSDSKKSDSKKPDAPATEGVTDNTTDTPTSPSSDEDGIEEFFDGLAAYAKSGDVKDFVDLTILGTLSKKEIEDVTGLSYSDFLDRMEGEMSDELFECDTISFKIDDITYYDDEDVEDFNKETHGYVEAEKIADVDFTITVDDETDSDTFCLAKINGKWYLADF